MIERHLVVADDAIVEVADIECAIGTELQFHGAKPRIIAYKKIGLLDRFEARTMRDELIAIHTMRNRIADEQIAAILGRKLLRLVTHDAGNAGRTVRVFHDLRPESYPVVRFAETRIIAPRSNK